LAAAIIITAAVTIKNTIIIKKRITTAAVITKSIIHINNRITQTMEATATLITRKSIKAAASFQAFSVVNAI
jgi:hypothetical protein